MQFWRVFSAVVSSCSAESVEVCTLTALQFRPAAREVIIHLDFPRGLFRWVDLQTLLDHWRINHDQFVDACLLAGTESPLGTFFHRCMALAPGT